MEMNKFFENPDRLLDRIAGWGKTYWLPAVGQGPGFQTAAKQKPNNPVGLLLLTERRRKTGIFFDSLDGYAGLAGKKEKRQIFNERR